MGLMMCQGAQHGPAAQERLEIRPEFVREVRSDFVGEPLFVAYPLQELRPKWPHKARSPFLKEQTLRTWILPLGE